LHSNPRVERAGDHHGPDPERHQPARQDQDGSRPRAQEQRQQAPPRHYGVQVCSSRLKNIYVCMNKLEVKLLIYFYFIERQW
jgi:hypothetical protein